MKALYYRRSPIFIILWLIGSQGILAQAPLAINYSTASESIIRYSPNEIQDQLRALPDPLVAPNYDPVVDSYVRTYTVKNRERTEKMLGKMELFFPIFERHLQAAGLPSALKYVPVLESALDPMATSRSGAAGLWQIMPITAKELKLRVSRYVDDRRDPEKSTKAAVSYLKKLYKRFGSWELALAAYNGGPGRVSRAIRKTGITDFWQLKKHLPRETRNYVSAFLGANYIANYYQQFELQPKYLHHRLQQTRTLNITQVLKFSEIAEIANLDVELIQLLNPRYARGYIPEKSTGYPLRVPEVEAAILINKLGLVGEQFGVPVDHRLLNYEVQADDDFHLICSQLKCRPAAIISWNSLTHLQLTPGQLINYYKPLPKKPIIKRVMVAEKIASRYMLFPFSVPSRKSDVSPVTRTENLELPVSNLNFQNSKLIQGKQEFYVVKSGDSLRGIAKKIPGTNYIELMKINKLKVSSKLIPGQQILLK